MAPDPDERYSGVEALGEDLRAFLEGRVVLAHRTGAFAELSKWVQRNRTLAGTVMVAVVLVLALSVGASLVLAGRNKELAAKKLEADQQRDLVVEVARLLQTNLRYELEASDLSDEYADLVDPGTIEAGYGMEELATQMEEQLATVPGIEATLRLAIGERLLRAEQPAEARAQVERAVALRRGTLGEVHPETLQALALLAELREAEGRLDEAVELNRQLAEHSFERLALAADLEARRGRSAQAGDLRSELVERARASGDARELLIALLSLADSRIERGELDEAEAELVECLELFEHPQLCRTISMTSELPGAVLGLLAEVRWLRDRTELGAELFEGWVASLREARGQDDATFVAALPGLASVAWKRGWTEAAFALCEAFLQAPAERRAESPVPVGMVVERLVGWYGDLGRWGDAVRAFGEHGGFLDASASGEERELLELSVLMSISRGAGDIDAAVRQGGEALALARRHRSALDEDTLYLMAEHAGNLSAAGRVADAVQLLRQCYARSRTVLGRDDPETLAVMSQLALDLADLTVAGPPDTPAQYEEAADLIEECLWRCRRAFGEADLRTIDLWIDFAWSRLHLDRPNEAVAAFEEVHELLATIDGELGAETLAVQSGLVVALAHAGDIARGVELGEACLEAQRFVLGKRDVEALDTQETLVGLLLDLPDSARALELARELVEYTPDSDPSREYRLELLQEAEGAENG